MRVLWISIIVILLDQLSKVAVLQYMNRHESIPILGDWFMLTFTENPGMAFGIQVGPEGTVTALALTATLLVVYYLYTVRNGYWPYRASLALILGGAIGNIVDRTLYGVIMGYGDLFTGRVVDFIHVSLWEGFVPETLPVIGGAYMELFPIWNVADMAIVMGVFGVLLFQGTFHKRLEERRRKEKAAASMNGQDGRRDGTPDRGSAVEEASSTTGDDGSSESSRIQQ